MPGKPAYQVIARKYRPQSFEEVLGQEAIVTTIKNGIKMGRLAHAYLFSGPRGTGKTTLARLLAKAINCAHPVAEFDPCNNCLSCQDIASGCSLDVIEIDGASNRGIDEMRQINESVGYTTSSGRYKIYIIDEVHMLTKEAFNALLKTLEEPPPNVKFFFATTEPHKVLPTILSRCQRFNLRRLSCQAIAQKLQVIIQKEKREVQPGVLTAIAARAEGGLRDAESLLDQLLSFYEGPIDEAQAAEALGTLPQEIFFQIDKAGKEGNLKIAFDIAAQIFHEGKDLAYFVQMLTEHFRCLCICKVAGADSSALEIPPEQKELYQAASSLYLKEQLLSIIELCLEAESAIRMAPSPRIALEGLLLKILRSHSKIPLDQLVKQLMELEKRVLEAQVQPTQLSVKAEQPLEKRVPEAQIQTVPPSVKAEQPLEKRILEAPIQAAPPSVKAEQPLEKQVLAAPPPPTPVKAEPQPPPREKTPITPLPRYDTVLQFAAVELEGKIIKK